MHSTYLVVERDPLIANDLLDTITEYDHDAAKSAVSSPQEAASWLENAAGAGLLTIIANMSVDMIVQSGLARKVKDNAARMVIIGEATDQPNVDALGWTYVNSPFTTQSILDGLRTFTGFER